MSIEKILVETERILEKPESFTTKVLARNVHDEPIGYKEEGACKFCMMGALSRACYNLRSWEFYQDATDLLIKTCGSYLPTFNDNNSYETIITKIREARNGLKT
jgi:hypothetical protein